MTALNAEEWPKAFKGKDPSKGNTANCQTMMAPKKDNPYEKEQVWLVPHIDDTRFRTYRYHISNTVEDQAIVLGSGDNAYETHGQRARVAVHSKLVFEDESIPASHNGATITQLENQMKLKDAGASPYATVAFSTAPQSQTQPSPSGSNQTHAVAPPAVNEHAKPPAVDVEDIPCKRQAPGAFKRKLTTDILPDPGPSPTKSRASGETQVASLEVQAFTLANLTAHTTATSTRPGMPPPDDAMSCRSARSVGAKVIFVVNVRSHTTTMPPPEVYVRLAQCVTVCEYEI